MTGPEYEQFVRAVLSEKLKLPPEELQSTHSPGATLPGTSNLQHQIDLFYVQETEVAKYVTIIECKYRGTRPVDQPLVQPKGCQAFLGEERKSAIDGERRGGFSASKCEKDGPLGTPRSSRASSSTRIRISKVLGPYLVSRPVEIGGWASVRLSSSLDRWAFSEWNEGQSRRKGPLRKLGVAVA